MPNWKSYEATIRLLSAIIAAHPGLKLNYDETAKYFGSGTKYKAIWHRMNKINSIAQSLRNAVEKGLDPNTIDINDLAQGQKLKHQDISARFGGGCTKLAIDNRFRRIKVDARLINEAIDKGIDPITLNIGGTEGEAAMKGRKSSLEIARICGSDCTSGSIRFQMSIRIKPLGKRQLELLASGRDPKDIDLGGIGKSEKFDNEIVKHFGSDCTKGGLEWRFRRFKAGAKLQAIAVKNGVDPKDINVDVNPKGEADIKMKGAIALYYDENTTAIALQHRFRPIKKVAAEMRTAIADKFGEGVTGKAVSTRFERMKKEAGWNLNNTEAENTSASKSGTPRKRAAATPKSTPKKQSSGNGNHNGTFGDSDDDEGSTFDPTPKKKSATLNKTKTGRVSKVQNNGRGRNNAVASPYIVDDEDDVIKVEVGGYGMDEDFGDQDIGIEQSWASAENIEGSGEIEEEEDEEEEDGGAVFFDPLEDDDEA